MTAEIWVSIGLVFLFILIGGVFAGTEIALVSLRQGQIDQLARSGTRGERAAAIARDPNRFLAAVQIGVTVAGFFSAAYGASTIAPALSPVFESLGLGPGPAATLSLVLMTLLIAYFSLVLGELVPKRLALQRSSALALAAGPPLGRFASLMRPAIAVLSASTNAVVRLLGGDPNQTSQQMDEDELRNVVVAHHGFGDVEREILSDVFAATSATLSEVMQPRHAVAFLDSHQSVEEALEVAMSQPYSRFPVRDGSVDDIVGFVHVRDLLNHALTSEPRADVASSGPGTVRSLARDILVLPGTNQLLPTITRMRKDRAHIAIVIDEYGGTDGIVTLEDLVEELIGDIHDEYDPQVSSSTTRTVAEGPTLIPGGYTLEEVQETLEVALPEGSYETISGFVMDRLGRVARVGDQIKLEGEQGQWMFEVTQMEGNRIVQLLARQLPGEPSLS